MSDQVLIALITGVVSAITSISTLIAIIITNKNVKITGRAVNGQMTELLKMTATASRLEGIIDQRKEDSDKRDNASSTVKEQAIRVKDTQTKEMK